MGLTLAEMVPYALWCVRFAFNQHPTTPATFAAMCGYVSKWLYVQGFDVLVTYDYRHGSWVESRRLTFKVTDVGSLHTTPVSVTVSV